MTRHLRMSGDPYIRRDHGERAQTVSCGAVTAIAHGVLMPDGFRTDRLDWQDPESGCWRRPAIPGLMPHDDRYPNWIYGRIEIDDHDVTFRDEAPQPRPRWNWPPSSLPGDLCASQLVAAYAQDFSNATRLYDTLCDTVWENGPTQFRFKNWRSVANLIAEIRDRTESFLDFTWSCMEGVVDEQSLDLLQSHGWELVQIRDNSNDAVFAEEIVVACESGPLRPTPLWYAYWALGLSTDDSLDGRMHRCAYRGQASYLEWTEFLSYQCSGELFR